MGLQLPGELANLLNELGYIWPKSDEQKLIELGQSWIAFGDTLHRVSQEATSAMRTAVADNTGDAIEAFKKKWGAEKSAATVLADAAAGGPVIGAVLFICAGVVLALKST
jgi:hypothetical protein